MIIEEIQSIDASIDRVWQGLNDPGILKLSLPGCEDFLVREENKFEVVMQAKIGPVKARFRGEIELSDINPPNSYTIAGSGKGGVAGFAKGIAKVSLSPGNNSEHTEMKYRIEVTVGGKLAQIGSRLVSGAAKKLSGEFFEKFGESLADTGKNLEQEAPG